MNVPTHELEVEIDERGQVKVHVKGAKGKACLEYVELVQEILSGKVVDQKLTNEYYEQPVAITAREQQQTQVRHR